MYTLSAFYIDSISICLFLIFFYPYFPAAIFAVSRGAFKAEEMTTVGGVYDRYAAGLSALTKQQEPDTSEAEENPPEEAGSKE